MLQQSTTSTSLDVRSSDGVSYGTGSATIFDCTCGSVVDIAASLLVNIEGVSLDKAVFTFPFIFSLLVSFFGLDQLFTFFRKLPLLVFLQ